MRPSANLPTSISTPTQNMGTSSIVNIDTEHASYGHEYENGITLSSMGILILYWLVTILTQSIMTDPNPSSSSSASTQPSSSSSSSQNQLQKSTSPKVEPFLVRLATSPALLSLVRILIALPALQLTFLTITSSANTPSPLPLHFLCPLLPTTSSPALLYKTTHHLSYLPALFPGVFLSLLTSPLRLLCFYSLGQSFTFTLTPPKHNKLIKTGFYKFVRHPSYLFALTGLLGFLCFVLGSGQGRVFVGCYALGLGAQDPEMKWVWTAAAIGFATIIEMFRERVISEEKFLEECVGRDEWEDYKRKTPWMFVPGVY